MAQLSSNLTLEQLLNKWSATLNPVLAIPLLSGVATTSVSMTSGVPKTINHRLGRTQIGWMITDQNAAAKIFRTQPFNDKTLTLQSDANVTINLWNY